MRSTHAVEIRGDVVTKRFRARDHDRPGREWRTLTLLAEHAPGLAPVPLRADPATVVMTRVEGVPIDAPVPSVRLDAMAAALTAIQRVPLPPGFPPRVGAPAEMLRLVRARRATRAGPAVARAVAAGERWLDGPDPERLAAADPPPVLGLGDGNIANHLWDGTRVRLVDFEYAGRSDRAYELAEAAEHVSLWHDDVSASASLLARFDLSAAEHARLRSSRRLMALFWLYGLPRDRQAERVLDLLGVDSDTV